ncbi:MAG: hypothetical protein EXQ53_06135 [Acidobacteria bacterium]|nr:hypothetical protein [Acidobacteriota bacterium]
MLRHVSFKVTVAMLVALGMIGAASAQQPAPAQGGGGAARASALPLFFDVNWARPGSQTGQVPVVQENIGDVNLELKQYGLHANCLLTSGNPGSETTPFSAWSGACEAPFATTFRHRTNAVDLTGASKIRWAVKTSGLHVVRPVVKLADGTMLVGETAAASVPMLAQSEVSLAAIRWMKLDPKRVVTMGLQGGAFNSIWVPNPDLSRVDEVGFVDLMPGSGHGTGGYIHVSQFQVYGRPVPRTATTTSR